MGETIRFGVSLDSDLLDKFDSLAEKRGYKNRSEALRDLMRDYLVKKEWESDEEIVGTITLVYDHHVHELTETLTDFQHDHSSSVLSTLHIHLDHDNCLEVIVVKGTADNVREFADRLISTKGVKHGKLTATTTGSQLR